MKFDELVKEASARLTTQEKVTRVFPSVVRRKAASRLTEYLSSIRPFSFIRLGDMELGLMIEHQHGVTSDWTELPQNQQISSSTSFGHPGLKSEYVERLIRAYEQATYVDFHERWWINRELNPLLKLDRPQDALRNKGEEDSHIFMDWVRYELKDYMGGRRILFAGGEAAVFQKLCESEAFRESASAFLDFTGYLFFEPFEPFESKIGDDLDHIKSFLKARIENNDIDTVFLSLGGGAKILSVELAQETGVCCFDFGGLMRGLTYSGSDGQMFCRSTHHPFFYRVPFNIYMDALEKAFPEHSPEQLLCKAQCQVFLDGAKHKVGESVPTPRFEVSTAERELLLDTFATYQKRYKHLRHSCRSIRIMDLEFQMRVLELCYGKCIRYWGVRLWKAVFRRLTTPPKGKKLKCVRS